MARSVIEGGSSKAAAARAFHATPKTVAKWVARFRAEGVAGLQDRSSRPRSSPSQTGPAACERVEALRRQRHTGEQIAAEVGVSAATVSRILKRLGLNRLAALEPAEPIRRYERAAPGEIVHIDIKKLGKFNRIGHRITGGRIGQSKSRRVGWEYVHLAIDDHARLAYSEILPDEKRTSCLRFLFNALRFFRGFGVRVERIMTDNGSSFRSHRYAKALRRLRIKHLRTKPYTPRTNGKAERFVQTSLREWAYARAYSTSQHRAAELPIWLHRYNVSSEHTSRYVVDAKRLCWATSCSAGCFEDLEDSSASLRAVEQLRSRRLKTQGPSGRGWIALTSPRSAASRRVRGATPTTAAAWLRFSQRSSPSDGLRNTGMR
jgi:transposase InsO family protein